LIPSIGRGRRLGGRKREKRISTCTPLPTVAKKKTRRSLSSQPSPKRRLVKEYRGERRRRGMSGHTLVRMVSRGGGKFGGGGGEEKLNITSSAAIR